MREGTNGSQITVYEGHPGGGFSTVDDLKVEVDLPSPIPSAANYTGISIDVTLNDDDSLYFEVDTALSGSLPQQLR